MFDGSLQERKPLPERPVPQKKRKHRMVFYAGLALGAIGGMKYGPYVIREIGQQVEAYRENIESRKIADCIENLEHARPLSSCN